MKNILITGAAGFIGSHLVKRLIGKGYIIKALDNLERGNIEFLNEVLNQENLNFIQCDLRNYDEVKSYFHDQDLVIHLASKVSGIGKYISNPYEIMNANIQMDLNVLRCVLENKIEKYFYASSAHIYPKELHQKIDSQKIKEIDAYPANPELSYGWAKLIGEKTLESAIKENEWLKVSIARFIGIYGPNQDYGLNTGSVIPVFSHRASKYPELPFSVWGTGEETRSYCYIDDALDCIESMIENMEYNQLVGPFNVGSKERNSIKDIAKFVIEASKKDISIEWDLSKPTILWGQWCDVEKIKNVIGWESKISLKEGIEKVYKDIEKRISYE